MVWNRAAGPGHGRLGQERYAGERIWLCCFLSSMGDGRLSSVQHNPQADRDSLSREATGSQLPPGLTVPFVALASGTAPLGHYCGGRRARLRGGRLGCVLADCFLQSQEPDSTSQDRKISQSNKAYLCCTWICMAKSRKSYTWIWVRRPWRRPQSLQEILGWRVC